MVCHAYCFTQGVGLAYFFRSSERKRQSEHTRRQWHCERPRQPTMQKQGPRFVLVSDVSPQVQELLLLNQGERQCQWINSTRPKMPHGDRDHTDDSPSLIELEFKRLKHLRSQPIRFNDEMQERYIGPLSD